ncbi:DUF4328 domain-containing protein [Winogradskyella psychrotolerans]|uniref:DUF4328 domain-containing protein n=1 Tax=Winogradskyella psychrotolerans TaxID=1344585 RepID=UPI001C0681D1|nr:DUF4328 domain-containing protein [Winogradskyella psychrotolerans]MBU2929920.1 DUF4328 domain-containing protein [Winogradskyella psychrotolerans]
MTEEQLEDCEKCLNRKRGRIDLEAICNIKGKTLDFEGNCRDFQHDNSVVSGKENKINAIKPNLKRAKLAKIFIWAVMALDILSIVSSYLQYNLLLDFQNNEFISDEMLESNDLREQLVAYLYLVVFIISAVTFIQWFRRAYYNLNIRANCDHSEGWAAGSWFVPIISLYRPYQIMKEMATKSTQLINLKTSQQNIVKTSTIGIWWTLWIISNYIGSFLFKSAFKQETIENYINATLGDIVLSLIGIPLAIVTVSMITSYSKKEEELTKLEKLKN